MSNNYPQPLSPSEMKEYRHNKPLFFTALILSLFILFFAFWYGYNMQLEQLQEEEDLKVIVDTSPINDPTADWQTYRNEEYGFEFKYPNLGDHTDFVDMGESNLYLIGFSPYLEPGIASSTRAANFFIEAYHVDGDLSLMEWFLNHEVYNNLLIENENYKETLLMNNVEVLRLSKFPLPNEFNEIGPIMGYTYFMSPDERTVIGILVGGQDNSLDKYGYLTNMSRLNLEDQIISTFKFISTSTSVTQ